MALAAALGCGAKSAPSVDGKPAVAATPRNIDAEVLLFLDPYDPMYLIDAQGRVVHLRMGGLHLPTPVMAEIGKLTELREFELGSAIFTDEGLAQLKDLQKLMAVGFGNTPLTDESLVHIAKLKGLRHTWLPNNKKITKEGIEKLKNAIPELSVH
jgi:hypothetical protein